MKSSRKLKTPKANWTPAERRAWAKAGKSVSAAKRRKAVR